MVKIKCFPDQREVEIEQTQTILEALLEAEISHTHVCGGRAYCSTCRVMILDGIQHCSPPTNAEKALAKQLDFPFHVRLACQTKVSGEVSIRRLVLDNEDIDFIENQFSVNSVGTRKTVAVLFATLRGGMTFDEVNFYYDMIYIMSRYFQRMHRVVNQYGGVIDNYMGPWFLAIFGLENVELAAERAVWAGLEMLQTVQDLNDYLTKLSYPPLKLSIGIHYGPAVLVPVDSVRSKMLNPIGEVMNWVSRIEAANREIGSDLLVSEAVYQVVQDHAIAHRSNTIRIPGKNLEFKVFEITQMQGEAPSKLEKAPVNEPLSKRIVSFVQKFANSWGKPS